MTDWLQRSIGELRGALAAREISSVELTTRVFERIEATQPTLNAFTSLRERSEVLAEAHAADTRLAEGQARPLEGIPLGV